MIRRVRLGLLVAVVGGILSAPSRVAAATIPINLGTGKTLTVDAIVATNGTALTGFDLSFDFLGSGILGVTGVSLGAIVPAASVSAFFLTDGSSLIDVAPPADFSTLMFPFDVVGALSSPGVISGPGILFSLALTASTPVAGTLSFSPALFGDSLIDASGGTPAFNLALSGDANVLSATIDVSAPTTVVPEPATITLLASGLGLSAMRNRRRGRHASRPS